MPVALTAVPRTYAELLRGLQEVLLKGQRAIDEAWVRTYHEAGRLITEHILLNKDRADYGAQVYNASPATSAAANAAFTSAPSSTAVSRFCSQLQN